MTQPELFDRFTEPLAQPREVKYFPGPEVTNTDAVRFNGYTKLIFDTMKSGEWMTNEELAAATGIPSESCMSLRRQLRTARLGGHTINRRVRSGRLFEYQLIPKGGRE